MRSGPPPAACLRTPLARLPVISPGFPPIPLHPNLRIRRRGGREGGRGGGGGAAGPCPSGLRGSCAACARLLRGAGCARGARAAAHHPSPLTAHGDCQGQEFTGHCNGAVRGPCSIQMNLFSGPTLMQHILRTPASPASIVAWFMEEPVRNNKVPGDASLCCLSSWRLRQG